MLFPEGVTVSGDVCTHFGRESIELAILQPPEDVLGAVATDAKVEAVHLAEGARPD